MGRFSSLPFLFPWRPSHGHVCSPTTCRPFTQPLRKPVSYLQDRARYAQAEPLFQRAVCIREQQVGPDHLQVASLLNGLANCYFYQGKFAQAEPLYLRTLRIWEQQLGPEHPQVAIPLNNLADLYREQGKFAQAEPLYLRALHIWQQQLGSEHPNVASPLTNLVALYSNQGKSSENKFPQRMGVGRKRVQQKEGCTRTRDPWGKSRRRCCQKR